MPEVFVDAFLEPSEACQEVLKGLLPRADCIRRLTVGRLDPPPQAQAYCLRNTCQNCCSPALQVKVIPLDHFAGSLEVPCYQIVTERP